MKRKTPIKGLTFEQGYICAVAQIIQLHDEPTIAEDVLRALGDVDWKTIDKYDRDIIRQAGLLPRGWWRRRRP